ncbi:hypothetical protein EDB92DRAFT_1948661 [Lactarius akahatsu]|uniref:Uncharacterized protein n=1 Tax=Lactarius akahatsu TaxID=416441 RepID=A0AAD4LB60_9AGAM|nr:hypothetical protein EDB92DRAFT_1948661 [Lactarius akahatsu]
MSHFIQSPLPELAKLSRLSTNESITSTVTVVKPSNEGRGGAGNAREASDYSQRASIFDGPEDFSSTKGRELPFSSHPEKIISTGRGGSGNVHSPSRDVIGAHSSELLSTTEAEQAKYERLLIRKHEGARAARMEEVVSETLHFHSRLGPKIPRPRLSSQSDRKMNANMTPQVISRLPVTSSRSFDEIFKGYEERIGKKLDSTYRPLNSLHATLLKNPQGLRRIPPPKPPPQLGNGWAERHTQQQSLSGIGTPRRFSTSLRQGSERL